MWRRGRRPLGSWWVIAGHSGQVLVSVTSERKAAMEARKKKAMERHCMLQCRAGKRQKCKFKGERTA